MVSPPWNGFSSLSKINVPSPSESVLKISLKLLLMIYFHGAKFDFFAANSWVRLSCVIAIFFCLKIAINVNILDKKGFIHRAKLQAFERYLSDFGDFKKNDIPDIAIWQYYIIFAVGLGIGDKVLENIEKCYI